MSDKQLEIEVGKVIPTTPAPPEKPKAVETMSLDELFSYKDSWFETFTVDGWPKPITIQSLTAGEMGDWVKFRDAPEREDITPEMRGQNRRDAGPLLFVMAWVQPDGSRIPKEKYMTVVELLKSKATKMIDGVVDRVMKMNGLQIGENVVKNVSRATTIEGSRTGSQHTSAT